MQASMPSGSSRGVRRIRQQVRDAIVRSPQSVVLLPSLDRETCVAEIVRRQVSRGPGGTTAQRAEAKIRARFSVYVYAGLPLPVVLTLRPPIDIATELAMRHYDRACKLAVGRVRIAPVAKDRSRGSPSDRVRVGGTGARRPPARG